MWRCNTWHWLIAAIAVSCCGNILSSATFEKFKGSEGCPPMQFRCVDAECITEEKHCDGHPDCLDASDEQNCDVLKCLAPNYFTCANNRCISSSFLCDGENDCEDGSDEHNCTNVDVSVGCSPQEFQCKDRLCVPQHWVCDGKEDCLDGSDEYFGCDPSVSCKEFQCHNHVCLPLEWQCDGSDDCGDNSDEINCPRREIALEKCSIDHRMFLCHDKEICIELFEVCNDKVDCLDGSDEGGHCHDSDTCLNTTCAHECFPSPNGPLCTCPKGMYNDGKSCKDVNECEDYGICGHKCVDEVGGYRCECDLGYTLAPDRRTCLAEGPEGLMLFSSQKQIRAYFLSSGVYYPVAKDISQVTGVAYDGQHVYWTNVFHGEESIMRSLEDGSEQEVIITAGLGSPEDLALDWLTGNIYFTDSKYQHVGVCSNNGEVCTVLHNRDIDKPRGIALSPAEGLMYWSDWGKRPLIARSGMDSSQVTDFVTDNIQWPNGLTIDHGNERLYWVDAKLLVIESIKLDGSGRRVVLSEAVKHPYAVAVFESSLYWSDWTGQEIQKCNKFTGKDRQRVIREKHTRIFGVHIYHPAMMSTVVDNPCVSAKCSDLCLLAPRSNPLPYSCACPQDKMMAPNSHTCERVLKNLSLVVGAGGSLVKVDHQRLGRLTPIPIPLTNVYKIGALAYDAVTELVMIYDAADKKIVSLNQLTGEVSVVLSGDIGRVEGMDVDPYGHNLYWADPERQTVEVMSLNTHQRKVLLQDLGGESPIDVVLVPQEGIMFVALMGPKVVHIDSFSMTGDLKSRVHIADKNVLGPNVALAYDRGVEHLFWADSGSGNIEAVDIKDMERIKIRELYHSPIDLAVIADDIFWTYHGSATLLWVNKYEEETTSTKQLPLGLTQGLESVKLAAVTGLVSGHEHACQRNNGGCSHICLVDTINKVCTCPFGMVLKSDAMTCEIPLHCQVGQFRCSSGLCIPNSMQCNRHPDCPDGDDETDCKSFMITCTRGMFSCHDGEKCVEHNNRCDGSADCRDGSDELNCFKESTTCKPGEFQCKSGACVPMSWRCDSVKDCEDESDEENCEKTACHSEREFRCKSGLCIPSSWECDGHSDCSDSSDEHQACLKVHTCAPDQLTCNNGHCVDRHLECNGDDDCEDGTDEEGCSRHAQVNHGMAVQVINDSAKAHTRPVCDESQFSCEVCVSGEEKCVLQKIDCLPASARCNGTAECLRGEDETGCEGCHAHQFQCLESGRCINKEWMCDGANDCGDNSDEAPAVCQHHTRVNTTYFAGKVECMEFTCKSSHCLPFSKVCDGKVDCSDGSDEGGRCGRGCAEASCMDTCQETPMGPKCGCFAGYELSGDSKSCTDVDECSLGVYCTQFCQNTPGSFTCRCRYPDYQLRDDRMTCKAKGPEMQIVYVLDNQIRYVTNSHSTLGVIYVSSQPNFQVSGLDVDSRKRCVYWSSAQVGTISRKCLSAKKPREQTELETISRLLRPGRLALDWLSENVYFVERGHKIKVCHFGMKKCAVVVTASEDVTIDTLAVDPVSRLMFWSESTGFGQTKSIIKRADLSGSLVTIVLDVGLQLLSDLVLDSLHQLVYWLDADRLQVERISYNGTNKQTIFESPDVPTKLGLFEHSVYWMVAARTATRRQYLDTYGNVWQCPVSGPAAWRCEMLKIHPRNTLTAPTTFVIMQEASQEQGISECSSQCSHICVTGGVCLCPNGTRVAAGRECGNTSAILGEPQFSNTVAQPAEDSSTLWTVFKVLMLTFIVLPAVIAILFVLRYDIMTLFHSCISVASKPVFSNIHFSNPAYNMSGSHLETAFHHSRLNPGEHQYENPMASDNLSEETVSTITNEVNEIPKKPKVIEFRINDFADDDSGSYEYTEASAETHKTPLIR